MPVVRMTVSGEPGFMLAVPQEVTQALAHYQGALDDLRYAAAWRIIAERLGREFWESWPERGARPGPPRRPTVLEAHVDEAMAMLAVHVARVELDLAYRYGFDASASPLAQ